MSDETPVDGLSGGASVSPKQLGHAIFALFYNKKFGLVLILAAGLLSLLGVLFPQQSSSTRSDPDMKAAWLDSVRQTFGGWTDILDTVGAFRMFSSIPFLVVMVLLALSIAACTIHRLPLLHRAAFQPRTKVTEEFFSRARYRREVSTSVGVDEAYATVLAQARAKKLHVVDEPAGPGRNVYIDRWRFMPFGTALAHLSFILIMAGFLISSLTGFRDEDFALAVGYPQEVGHDTGLVAEALSFEDSYYEDGSPKDYVTDLAISKDGEEVARQEVRVNSPLKHDGIMFHQASFGTAIVLHITQGDDEVFHNGVPLNHSGAQLTYGVQPLPGTGYEVFVTGPGDASGAADGQARIEVYPVGSQEVVASGVVDQGASVHAGELTITFERESPYTGILVKKDPGTGVVWAGFALLVIGMSMTMFFRHHRVWVRVSSSHDGARVRFASPDKRDSAFGRRFNAFADDVEQQLGRTLSETKG